ncbi:MAG: ribonuclease R, partial [Hyphomicrobiales bacterium]
MARKSRSSGDDAGTSLPTREDIVAFIARSQTTVGKREIARAFGLKGEDKIALKHLLDEFEEDGTLARSRKGFAAAGALPKVLALDITGRDDDGDLVGVPAEWEPERGPLPRVSLVVPRHLSGPAPGVGSRVLVRMADGASRGAHVGTVTRVLERARPRQFGVFRRHPDGSGRILSIEKRNAGRELAVGPDDTGDALDGDLVAVDLVRTRRGGVHQLGGLVLV